MIQTQSQNNEISRNDNKVWSKFIDMTEHKGRDEAWDEVWDEVWDEDGNEVWDEDEGEVKDKVWEKLFE